MKRRLLPLLFGLLHCSGLCTSAHAQIVIIANPNVSVTGVSKTELRDILTGASARA